MVTVPPAPPTAVLFPGQGSQTDEMRDEVAARRPDLLALAAEVVGEDPFARVEEGTRYAQPAIYCASLVGWEQLCEAGVEAAALAAARRHARAADAGVGRARGRRVDARARGGGGGRACG
jgi:malonyl CoA-acyl carrier protein transacylase